MLFIFIELVELKKIIVKSSNIVNTIFLNLLSKQWLAKNHVNACYPLDQQKGASLAGFKSSFLPRHSGLFPRVALRNALSLMSM